MGVIGRLSVSTLQAQTVKKIWQSIAVLQQSPHGGEGPLSGLLVASLYCMNIYI